MEHKLNSLFKSIIVDTDTTLFDKVQSTSLASCIYVNFNKDITTLYKNKHSNHVLSHHFNGVVIYDNKIIGMNPKVVTPINPNNTDNVDIDLYDVFIGYDSTVVTLYHNVDKWSLMTYNHNNANNMTYFKASTTLSQAFDEALKAVDSTIDYDKLDKSYSYCFALSHSGWQPLCTTPSVRLIQVNHHDTFTARYTTVDDTCEIAGISANMPKLIRFDMTNIKSMKDLDKHKNDHMVLILRAKSQFDFHTKDFVIFSKLYFNTKKLFYQNKIRDLDYSIAYNYTYASLQQLEVLRTNFSDKITAIDDTITNIINTMCMYSSKLTYHKYNMFEEIISSYIAKYKTISSNKDTVRLNLLYLISCDDNLLKWLATVTATPTQTILSTVVNTQTVDHTPVSTVTPNNTPNIAPIETPSVAETSTITL
jgi:hypothetical protein